VFAELVNGLVQLGLPATGDDDLGALSDESSGGGSAGCATCIGRSTTRSSSGKCGA
jgi:hypothetical protein